jgi:lysophospholipase L1-like esterase
MARRRLSRSRLIAFSALSFALFLVALELALRLLSWRIAPPTVGHSLAIAPPDPAAFRVVAVGDSWVYGAESEPEEAFIEVFRRRIEEKARVPVQIWNRGVPASNSAQALVDLVTVLEQARPHLVVALSGANDMLHDSAVDEAARLMGEDARMSRGWSWASDLRLARFARWGWIAGRTAWESRGAAAAAAAAGKASAGAGAGAAAGPGASAESASFETGGAALPAAPQRRPSPVVELPWWPMFVQRRWEDGLGVLRGSTPPGEDPRLLGVQRAWEALFLAHLDRRDEAESAAADALARGGDEATAWEARAVLASRADQGLLALQARIRAADAEGHPFIRDRARGLALLDLEAFQASESWLLSCNDAVPGNLEVLMGLARLPGASRGADAEAALFAGPRGMVSAAEWFRWHIASSGSVARAAASLGDPEPDEAVELRVMRAESAERGGDAAAARLAYGAALASPGAREIDRSRARAGLLRIAAAELAGGQAPALVLADLESALGGPVPAIPLDASVAPSLVAWQHAAGDCAAALDAGQRGLFAGMAASELERAAGGCLSRELGWSLAEQALARGPVLDRAALVLGQPAGSLPSAVPPPPLPKWRAFRERRWAELLADPALPADWRAWVLALDERPVEALRAADAALARPAGASGPGPDPAVLALARATALRTQGRWSSGFLELARAATSQEGDAWVRTLAQGLVLADARRWRACQRPLLDALRPAPGWLEALEALGEVPAHLRLPASELALRHVPSGRVPPWRWSAWYLAQGRLEEARRALLWPDTAELDSPRDRALLDLARARIALAADVRGEAESHLESAAAAVEDAPPEAELSWLGCRALAARALVRGGPPDPMDAAILGAACPDHPDSFDVRGRAAALRGACDEVRSGFSLALDAGADPAELLDWTDPCVPIGQFDEALRQAVKSKSLPSEAADWLLHRVHPGTDDEGGLDEAAAAAHLRFVRHLGAMARLSRTQGATFVALDYPFPGAHHQRYRDALLAAAPAEGIPVLDLYGHFDRTFSDSEWQAMRTPEDHVDARGYAEMGERLADWVLEQGLPAPR